jgi:hypothetical protein
MRIEVVEVADLHYFNMTDGLQAKDSKEPTLETIEIIEVPNMLDELLISHIPATREECWLGVVDEDDD